MRPFLILTLVMNLMACQDSVERTNAKINTEHRIEIDNCGVLYNGRRLEFGVPLELWEDIIGKSQGAHASDIWNDLGIGVVQTRINQERPSDAGDTGCRSVYGLLPESGGLETVAILSYQSRDLSRQHL